MTEHFVSAVPLLRCRSVIFWNETRGHTSRVWAIDGWTGGSEAGGVHSGGSATAESPGHLILRSVITCIRR